MNIKINNMDAPKLLTNPTFVKLAVEDQLVVSNINVNLGSAAIAKLEGNLVSGVNVFKGVSRITYNGITYEGHEIKIHQLYDYTQGDDPVKYSLGLFIRVDGIDHKIVDTSTDYTGIKLLNSNTYAKVSKEEYVVPEGTVDTIEILNEDQWVAAGRVVDIHKHSSSSMYWQEYGNTLSLLIEPHYLENPYLVFRDEMYGTNAEGLDHSCLRVYTPGEQLGILDETHMSDRVLAETAAPYQVVVWYEDWSDWYDVHNSLAGNGEVVVPIYFNGITDSGKFMYIEIMGVSH